MDFYGLVGFGIMAFVSGILTAIAALGYIKKSLFFENLVENIIMDVSTDDELQKAVYQLGGILGSGIKGGIGIDLPVKNRGGRFKWQDLALELGAKFIESRVNFGPPTPGTPTPQAKDKFFNT